MTNPTPPGSAVSALVEPICCSDCLADLSSTPNLDGLAETFRNDALYLCPTCADKRFNLTKPKNCGDFRLLRVLGVGGMGIVFLAWDPRTFRLGAVKKISKPFPDAHTTQRFLRESGIMAGLVHPHLVRLFRQGVHGDVPFLFSEFMDAGPIGDRFKTPEKRSSIEQACRWSCELLSGLDFFHSHGYVHRDIKPANILLKKRPRGGPEIAKLGDFGLAKSIAAAGGTILTRPNETCGSLQYAAPEQVVSYTNAGPAADIYSMGVSLYQMVTGSRPYEHALKTATLREKILVVLLEKAPTPVLDLNPSVPEDLVAIINQAMQKNPAYRFHSAREFQDALETFLVGRQKGPDEPGGENQDT